MFLAGLGWFTLASVLCAAAPGTGWLIAARAVQGIAGALMTPGRLAIIEASLRPGDRTRAIGTWAGFSGGSSAIAPFLGGWLLQAGSWTRGQHRVHVRGKVRGQPGELRECFWRGQLVEIINNQRDAAASIGDAPGIQPRKHMDRHPQG